MLIVGSRSLLTWTDKSLLYVNFALIINNMEYVFLGGNQFGFPSLHIDSDIRLC